MVLEYWTLQQVYESHTVATPFEINVFHAVNTSTCWLSFGAVLCKWHLRQVMLIRLVEAE